MNHLKLNHDMWPWATALAVSTVLVLSMVVCRSNSVPRSKQAAAASCPIQCGGTDDTKLLADALASSAQVIIPAGQTCAVETLKIPASRSVRCEQGAGIKKTGDPSKFLLEIRDKDVGISGCMIDGAAMALTTQHQELVYLQNARASFDHLTLKNVGSGDDNLDDVFRAWDSDFSLSDSTADGTVRGTVVKFLPNKKLHRLRVLGNTIDGLGNSAVYVGNDGAWGPVDMEISGNSISHCTDAGHQQSGTGEAGNAIQIWQTHYGSIHSNVLRENRFAGVRLAKTANVMVWGNLMDGNGETSLYCSELGGYSNHCFDNTILNFNTGISAVNQNQRPADHVSSPDIIENNHLSNGIFMGIALQGSIASGNVLDGVPIGIRIGMGTSYGHIAKNNTCLTSDPAAPPMISCLEIQYDNKQGIDVIDANTSSAGFAGSPVVGSNFGMWSKVSSVSNAPHAVVTATGGTLPKAGETACLVGVQGMDRRVNGQCAKVLAVSGSEYTLELDTSAMPAYHTPDGGQEPYMQVLYKSDGAPKYTLPVTMLLRNMMVPQRYLSGLSDGSDFYVAQGDCLAGNIQAGAKQVHAFKSGGTVVCSQ